MPCEPLQILCLGAIPTISKLAAAARSSGWPNSTRLRVSLGGVQRHRGSGGRGATCRRAVRRLQRLKGPLLKTFQDGFMPFVGAEVKAVFEELKTEVSPDLIFTHNRQGRTSGPPPDSGVDLEYVSGPSDSGVRDSEVRRRPGTAELCSCRWQTESGTEEGCVHHGCLPVAARASAGFKQRHFSLSCGCEEWNAMLPAATPRPSTAASWYCRVEPPAV